MGNPHWGEVGGRKLGKNREVQYGRKVERAAWKEVGGGWAASWVSRKHRRRIYTEQKAKVVNSIWGTEFIQFLDALATLHQDGMKNRMNCTRMI